MKDELEKQLRTDFPELFTRKRKRGEPAHPINFGIGCDDGWYDIVRDLCIKLSEISRESGRSIKILQIKEKFGTLRYYYSLDGKSVPTIDIHSEDGKVLSLKRKSGEEIREIIDAEIQSAYLKSSVTCEECGSPGKLRQGGWTLTLCDECDNKKKEIELK